MKLTLILTILFGCLGSSVPGSAESIKQTPNTSANLAGILSQPLQVAANPPKPVVLKQPDWASRGAPGRRRGGGPRGGGRLCQTAELPLIALVPGVEAVPGNSLPTASQAVRGLTVEAYPAYWFYVPYTASKPMLAEFLLQDDQNQQVYKGSVLLKSTPGIISIRPTPNSGPLLKHKDYRWSFSIVCNNQDRSADVVVKGLVHRVDLSPNLTARLTTTTSPQQQAALYAEAGIWHETITALVKLYSVDPKAATLQMANLLRSVNLDSIIGKQVVPCCALQEQQ